MTNNTIPNVSRELLCELRDAANESMNATTRQHQIDHFAGLIAKADALLSAPSPAGVDGLGVAGYIGGGTFSAATEAAFASLGSSIVRPLCIYDDAQAIIDGLRGEVERLERAEKNDSIAYKAVLERQDELRAELAAIKAKSVMPDVNAAAKALCSRHAAICGVDEDDQWKEYGQDFIADAETVLANSRLCAATVLEVNAHCAVIPEPYGWVAAGSFYTDRESAICAAEKTPCIDVYSRPQMNALENRSLQRQELAEELARQLNASCAEIRNMRNLYAAPVSEAKAQGVVLTDEELCSIRNQVACNGVRRDDDSRTICVKHGRALEAAVLARLNAAPSPAGVDGLEAVGTLRYFMDYPDSPHSAPGYITHQFNPASWDHAGEAAGEHKLCRLSDAQAIIDGLRGEVADLHTTMMAAAVEIQEHWAAHCDEEGYGPANLMHRLERGIASQYGYSAETLVRLESQRDQQAQRIGELASHLEFAVTMLTVAGLDENAQVEAMRAALSAGKEGE